MLGAAIHNEWLSIFVEAQIQWPLLAQFCVSQAHNGHPPVFQQSSCPWLLLEVADCAAHHDRNQV